DHTFAAPVLAALPFRHDLHARSVRLFGIGSQLHLSAPVLASNARTMPLGASARSLSVIAEPTITRSPATAGGEVMWYSPGISFPSRFESVTCPRSPKSSQGFPVVASSAISRPSFVARNIRRPQVESGAARLSCHAATPRQVSPSPYGTDRSIFGSYCHRAFPVCGSSATTLLNGVTTNNVSQSMIGVSSNCGVSAALLFATSPVRYTQATFKFEIVRRLIESSGEKRAPPGSRP